MFEFSVQHKAKNSRARTGTLKTPHGVIHTPVFMPVGTAGVVKTLHPDEVKSLGADIILANTYHLYLRPGEKLIKKFGGLHKWMGWKEPILTDSGGFQIFSLAIEDRPTPETHFKPQVKVTDEGVEFRSHIDGSKHFLTPEKAIQIEVDLGADIIMAFDECIPAKSNKTYANEAMERTHKWAIRCKKEFEKLQKRRKIKQALFPIIQGCIFEDLRIESAKFMANLDLPGIAIGGLSVGETKQELYSMLEVIHPYLPADKPRYLMGVGTPEDLLKCIDRGIDMFDCVLVTRMSRHGAFWTSEDRMNIRNAKYKSDKKPLMENCACSTCKTFSRSYLHHLFKEGETLGLRLMTIHNLHFLLDLMAKIRESIKRNTFQTFKKKFLSKFKPT